MTRNHPNTILCPLCQKEKHRGEVVQGELIHSPVLALIQKKHPDWSVQNVVCLSCLNHFRADYVQEVLKEEKGELTALEAEVIRSLKEHEWLSRNVNAEFDRQLTLGERLADRVAEFGGSWGFIFAFAVVMAAWIALNSLALLRRPFDPYPFILLNLMLSCLAAIQAPNIMMSQNRQEAKDRLRGEHDYRINLKAETEIRLLNTKMDQLLTHQWQRLLEIQQVQMELMEELVRKPRRQLGA